MGSDARAHVRVLRGLILITGKDKPLRTVLSKHDYEEVRKLGREFLSRVPRSVD